MRRPPHVYINRQGWKFINGYAYLGRVRVPPIPNRIAMQDRTTGEFLVLSHTGTSPTLALDLVPVLARWQDVTKYGKYEGPFTGPWRLYIDSGVLFAEASPYNDLTPTQGRILTRKAYERTVLEVTVDSAGSVVLTEIDL